MPKTKPRPETASGTVLMIPLNKLEKSPRNARKTPHPKADIEALAASISANTMLQSPVVEPETKDGKPTGYYLVTIGEGRRQAQLLRAKRKEISKTEPVRCIVDTAHNAFEISLAENAIRSAMHPADQFDAFHALHTEHGQSAEDIAARFGVTPAVVKQRLKLAAVSPKLIAAYRAGDLTLDQLTAFAVSDDHARQEAVFEDMPTHADREDILATLNEEHVASTDPRARFVTVEAYRAAGGAILHDLFAPEDEGFLTDPVLLDRLAGERLQALAEPVRAEGWKWVEIMPRYDHAFTANMRHIYPKPRTLSEAEEAKLETLETEYEALTEDDSEEAAKEIERIEQEIAELRGEDAYDPEDITRAGVVIGITHNGAPRIERGYLRPEDDTRRASTKPRKARGEGPAPLSEKLVAELTASRTMALRAAFGQQPAVALTALVHVLAAAAFYTYQDNPSCLDITLRTPSLLSHAPKINDSPEAHAIEARHEALAKRLPDNPAELWNVIEAFSQENQLALLAHCVSLSINGVLARGAVPESEDKALPLVKAVALDMSAHWQPTTANYLGRVSKERILEALREGVSVEAADNLAAMKKAAMADGAEQRLKGRNWLPPILRIPTSVTPLAVAAE